MTPVWLASGSPRRAQLLTWAGVSIDVRPADVEERLVPGESPQQSAQRLATLKAIGPSDRTVLAADTLVHLHGEVLGKPVDAVDAARMLSLLSGVWHQVTTGVAIRAPGERLRVFEVTTKVRMRSLPAEEISRYVATGEPLDKAGAYGIQGIGGALVAEVIGSWTNVMGLPLEETLKELRR